LIPPVVILHFTSLCSSLIYHEPDASTDAHRQGLGRACRSIDDCQASRQTQCGRKQTAIQSRQSGRCPAGTMCDSYSGFFVATNHDKPHYNTVSWGARSATFKAIHPPTAAGLLPPLPAGLPYLIYTHHPRFLSSKLHEFQTGHRLRTPALNKAQFVTALGIIRPVQTAARCGISQQVDHRTPGEQKQNELGFGKHSTPA
jgi:hypothetical protein